MCSHRPHAGTAEGWRPTHAGVGPEAGEIRVIKEVGRPGLSRLGGNAAACLPFARLSFFSRPSGPVGFFRFEKMATSFIDSSFNTKAEYDAWLKSGDAAPVGALA